MNTPEDKPTGLVEVALEILQEADTLDQWTGALMALWLAVENESEFEVELIDHTDNTDDEIARAIEHAKAGRFVDAAIALGA